MPFNPNLPYNPQTNNPGTGHTYQFQPQPQPKVPIIPVIQPTPQEQNPNEWQQANQQMMNNPAPPPVTPMVVNQYGYATPAYSQPGYDYWNHQQEIQATNPQFQQAFQQGSQQAYQLQQQSQRAQNHMMMLPTSTGGHGLTEAQTAAAYSARYPRNVYHPNQTSQGYFQQGDQFFDQHGQAFTPTVRATPQVQMFSGGAAVVPNKTQQGFDFFGIKLPEFKLPSFELKGMWAPQTFKPNVANQIATMFSQPEQRTQPINFSIPTLPKIDVQPFVQAGQNTFRSIGLGPIVEAGQYAGRENYLNNQAPILSAEATAINQTIADYKQQGKLVQGPQGLVFNGTPEEYSGLNQKIDAFNVNQSLFQNIQGLQEAYIQKITPNKMSPISTQIADFTKGGAAWWNDKVVVPTQNAFHIEGGTGQSSAMMGALVGSPGQLYEWGGMLPGGAETLIRNVPAVPAIAAYGTYKMGADLYTGFTTKPIETTFSLVGQTILLHAAGKALKSSNPFSIETIDIPRGAGQIKYDRIIGEGIIPNANRYTVAIIKNPFKNEYSGGKIIGGVARTIDKVPGAWARPFKGTFEIIGDEGKVTSTKPFDGKTYTKPFTGNPKEIMEHSKIDISSGRQWQEGDVPWSRGTSALMRPYLEAVVKPAHMDVWRGGGEIQHGVSQSSMWQPQIREPFGQVGTPAVTRAGLNQIIGGFSQEGKGVISGGSRASKVFAGEGFRDVTKSDFDTYVRGSAMEPQFNKVKAITERTTTTGKVSPAIDKDTFHVSTSKEIEFVNAHRMEQYPTFAKNPVKVPSVAGDVYVMDPRIQIRAKIGGMLSGWKQEPGKQIKLVHNPGRVKDVVDSYSLSRAMAADLYIPRKWDVGGILTKRQTGMAQTAESFSSSLERYAETQIKRNPTNYAKYQELKGQIKVDLLEGVNKKPVAQNDIATRKFWEGKGKANPRLSDEGMLFPSRRVFNPGRAVEEGTTGYKYKETKTPGKGWYWYYTLPYVPSNPIGVIPSGYINPTTSPVSTGYLNRPVELGSSANYYPISGGKVTDRYNVPSLSTPGEIYNPVYKDMITPAAYDYYPASQPKEYSSIYNPSIKTTSNKYNPLYTPKETKFTNEYSIKPLVSKSEYKPMTTTNSNKYTPGQNVLEDITYTPARASKNNYTPNETLELTSYVPGEQQKYSKTYIPSIINSPEIYAPKIATEKELYSGADYYPSSYYPAGGGGGGGLITTTTNRITGWRTNTNKLITTTGRSGGGGGGGGMTGRGYRNVLLTPPLVTTPTEITVLIEGKREVKRRKRRGVLVSQFNVKVPVPRLSQLLTPMKFKYNKDPMPFNLKRSGTKVIVETFPGGTEWLRKGGRKL